MRRKSKNVSIVIPVYNEAGNILPLTKKLAESIERLSLDKREILFVDDGSTDNTYVLLQNAQKKLPFLRIIKLRRNFGKAAAYSVGFSHAKYDIIVTLDGDLQDDPNEIKLFLDKIDEGYDLVTGWKTKGKGTRSKTILSRFFNFVVAKTFGVKLHDFNCPFKAYRREVIEGIKIYSGLYRFIPIFAHNYGFKIAEIKIKNLPRHAGKSKYGGTRIIAGFFDFLTALFLIKYNRRPMHFFGTLAILSATIGTIILAYLTYLSFMGEKVGSRPIFSLGVLLEIMSLQFFSIGFIGEMFTQSIIKVEPDYLVKEIQQ